MKPRVAFALGVLVGSLSVPLGAFLGRAIFHRTVF